MTTGRRLGLVLIVVGLAVVLGAPLAGSCFTDFHATSCETSGTVVLKVVGVALVAVAALALALGGGSTRESGDATR
jgi:multisubunit Na+/H+ antiporter MnhG subunit